MTGSTGYESDVEHYFNSSAAASTCSVEPGNAADVGKLVRIQALFSVAETAETDRRLQLQIVGQNKAPFGVR